MTKVVMVAGVARSGTSMTTGMLKCIGVELPGLQNDTKDNLAFNPWGSHETRAFDFFLPEANKALIPHAGKTPPKDIIEWLDKKYSPSIKKVIDGFKTQCGGAMWCGFKANGNVSLDLLLPHVDHLIVVTRSLIDNAKSYQVLVEESARQQNGKARIDLEKSLMECAWSQNALMSAVHRTPNLRKTFVTYEGIKADDGISAAHQIATDLGIAFNIDLKNQVGRFVHSKFSTWSDKGNRAEFNK